MDLFGDDETPTTSYSEALRLLRKVAPARTTLPILRNVLIVADGTTASLYATDLDVACCVRIPWKGASGRFMAPLEKLVAGIPLEQCMVPELDYPMLPEPGSLFPCPWWSLVAPVSAAMSDDPTRLSLDGVVVQHDGVTATDGHSLIHRHMGTGIASEMIIPRELVELIAKRKGVDGFSRKDGKIHFLYPWGWIAGKDGEGPYPNWRQVVPKETEWRVDMPMEHLRTMLKEVPRLKGLTYFQMVRRNGVLTVSCEHPAEKDSADLDILDSEGPDFRIRVNATIMPGLVAAVPGPVFTWRGNTETQATLIGEGEDIHLIMPCRWNG